MNRSVKDRAMSMAVAAVALGFGVPSYGAPLYWDGNLDAPGAGTAPTGTWSTTVAMWNDVEPGTNTPVVYAAGSDAIFAAGGDATGAYTVTVSGTQTATSLAIEEGAVSIVGGAVSLGGGPITVALGATLQTDSSLRISTTAGSKATLNGGTLRTTNAGSAGTFFDQDTEIIMGVGGGTLSSTALGILNIVQTGTKISGTGSLTKAGAGVLAFAGTVGNNTYSGGTIVNDGELRIRLANTLPATTALTVNSPGIFNLNGLAQTVSSLTGTGNVGTGTGTLTINGTASTSFDGAVKNIANAGASGVTSGNGKIVKNGIGVITFNGVNDINGSVTLNGGGIVVSSTGSLAGDIADLTINAGTLTLNNAAEKVENLTGAAAGNLVLGPGNTLTTDAVASTTFNGTISGSGSLRKDNALSTTLRILTLTGNNSFTGSAIVNGGTLEAAGVGANQSLGGITLLDINASPTAVPSAFVLALSDEINDTAAISLDGGTFRTASTVEGAPSTPGAGIVSMGASSFIDLVGTSLLAFANSSGAPWTGTLNIYNYTGTPITGGGAEGIYFGSDASGLTPAQLSQISFFSDAGVTPLDSAGILSTGEVVPVPEPVALGLLACSLPLLARRRRA